MQLLLIRKCEAKRKTYWRPVVNTSIAVCVSFTFTCENYRERNGRNQTVDKWCATAKCPRLVIMSPITNILCTCRVLHWHATRQNLCDVRACACTEWSHTNIEILEINAERWMIVSVPSPSPSMLHYSWLLSYRMLGYWFRVRTRSGIYRSARASQSSTIFFFAMEMKNGEEERRDGF